MREIKTKMNMTLLGSLTDSVKLLMDVPNKAFAKLVLDYLNSIEESKKNFGGDTEIQKLKGRIKELEPEILKFEKERDGVLVAYAEKDELGRPMTKEVNGPQGIVNVYVFETGRLLKRMSEQELKDVFGDADISDYAMIGEDGTHVLDENGRYTFSDTTSVESIKRFGELNAVELKYMDAHKELMEIQQLIQNEAFEVEIKAFESSDFPECMSANDILKAESISGEALDSYRERVFKN